VDGDHWIDGQAGKSALELTFIALKHNYYDVRQASTQYKSLPA